MVTLKNFILKKKTPCWDILCLIKLSLLPAGILWSILKKIIIKIIKKIFFFAQMPTITQIYLFWIWIIEFGL